MHQLILKKNIDKSNMNALVNFLKSRDIEFEFKTTKIKDNEVKDFSLSVGLWQDYDIDANELRNKAWRKNK